MMVSPADLDTRYLDKLSSGKMTEVLAKALEEDWVRPEDTSIVFYDLSRLDLQLDQLNHAFPAHSIHAVAMKANPVSGMLTHLRNRDFGLEVASMPELMMAKRAGFEPSKIVFDSPVKTRDEILFAVENGIYLNIDNFDELERVSSILGEKEPTGPIGIRINPQVGLCRYSTTSVAGTYSKFGVSLGPFQEELREAFRKHKWLTGVHLHIGSQGCNLLLLMEGIEKIYDFVSTLNSDDSVTQRVQYFDIGGGLPVFYRELDPKITLHDYVRAIRKKCPELLTEEFTLVTEFGRYLHAHNGWTASRVEYVKDDPKGKTAVLHVGADMFLRECYHPEDWHHDFSVANSAGKLKSGRNDRYTLAGPLCFAGDMLAKKWPLPTVEVDDFILIHDVGAYTFSMWSRYNSRPFPRVLGYFNQGEKFVVLKERESIDSIEQFWK